MRFWDSSALVPLICREVQSARCRAWLRADPVTVVWALAGTEVVSALARKRRDGAITSADFSSAKRRLVRLEVAWNEVANLDAVRARARRLLESHPLRAADALHLGAALVAVEERPHGIAFVTFDLRLADAAEREGFEVLSGTSA
ncbi:MAG: type II toxin-antitoxin system VapC family toxin [Proteobacteria bacterium]|nr:type II toxin-antitoxin system VapC family toxin [Pseudomonadota bacterium]